MPEEAQTQTPHPGAVTATDQPKEKKPKEKKKRRIKGEGSLFFNKTKGLYIARAIVGYHPDGRVRYKECSGRTKIEALEKKREAEKKGARGLDKEKTTLGEYLDRWLTDAVKPSVEETTYASYERCVRKHIKPRIGGFPLGELSATHVQGFFAELHKDEVSGGNAKKVGEVLSSALEQAVRDGLIPVSPASSVTKPKAERKEIQPFTSEEVKRILAAAASHRLHALFALAAGTGAREGELLALNWSDVDFKEGTLSIRKSLAQVKGGGRIKETKSKRGVRVVSLPTFCIDALRAHRERMEVAGLLAAPVFCTRTGGYLSKSSFVRQDHKPLLARAQVRYRKFHTFRHTHVSELLAAGESVVEVARRIGDSPEVVLKTYAHYLPSSSNHLASKIDRLYSAT
jgi:integrase